MYAALRRIYKNTKKESYLTNAVAEGWITEDEKAKIMGEIN